MILNVRKYKLDDIELRKNEMKLVLLLSDNDYHALYEMTSFLGIYTRPSIWKTMRSVNKKAKENIIKCYYNRGYKIDKTIKLDY